MTFKRKSHPEAEALFKSSHGANLSDQTQTERTAITQVVQDKIARLKSLRLAKETTHSEAAGNKAQQHMTEERSRVLWSALGCPTQPGIYDWNGYLVHVEQPHVDAAEGNPDAICYLTAADTPGPMTCTINSVELPEPPSSIRAF